jgi:hemerythrin-like domain-containing protein
MPIQIGEKPQADFDNPLGMLSDCHRRIERFLAALVHVARQKNGGSLDDRERAALQSALDYFRHSGPRHTADEEESLFPRMRGCSEAADALASIQALHEDHIAADRAHAEVDQLVSRWLSQQQLDESEAKRLNELLYLLSTLYARHIKVEDSEVFPAAARALNAGDIARIGDEMARRRGLR